MLGDCYAAAVIEKISQKELQEVDEIPEDQVQLNKDDNIV